tara:strand:+ start:166 stop:1209 length:1044 start_codon:yes stop_codon:yes gene_type:complete
MRFFDSKEEVLDIQLTQYGRHILSKGEWKPEYYAFFDDNIVYDSKFAGFQENRNDTKKRIQEETPYLETQHSFTGRDEYLFDGLEDIADRVKLSVYERMNILTDPLGTSSPEATKTPSYSITFLQGEIDSAVNHMTGNTRNENTVNDNTGETTYSHQLLKIPQIESDIEYSITAVDPEDIRTPFEADPELTTGNVYLDGASVAVGPEQILLLVTEENAPFDYKNFDIEVFEITEGIGALGEQVLTPLSFMKPLEMVQNNILLDKEEAMQQAGRIRGNKPILDPTYVEYYFNVFVDEEVDENLICQSISQLRSKNFYVDMEINCPDLRDPISADIYASDAEEEDCPDD